MNTLIKNKNSFSKNENLILYNIKNFDLPSINLSNKEKKFIKNKIKDNKEIIIINQYNRYLVFINAKELSDANKFAEKLRNIGAKIQFKLRNEKSLVIVNENNEIKKILNIAEGLCLANYSYLKHKSNPINNNLKTIFLHNIKNKYISELQNIINAVYLTRDLINEPFSHLKAKDLANEAKKLTSKLDLKVTIFNKKKIQGLNMGGLLAVNQGSLDDPTFSIIEWKPKKRINSNPIILVGKGIVYDTGGLSLKPTANSMDLMKIDMGGAGTVIGAMYAIAANKLDKHVIALLPATDNRPSGNAYAPGDVITMYDGTTVEVLNTDAEGRLILADALAFAKKYNPKLVIDLATLTGSAVAAIGHYGSVSMHKNAKNMHEKLKEIGENEHERLAELPFWDDYDKLIESQIADIKNIGGPHAGAITAGKFLSKFINYPWIHIDLAGVYSKTKYSYRGQGATGFGVRLLYQYIKHN